MEKIEWNLDENAEPQGSSDGFWYDITDGGYIDLEKLIVDKEQLKKANNAIDLLISLQNELKKKDLLIEF